MTSLQLRPIIRLWMSGILRKAIWCLDCSVYIYKFVLVGYVFLVSLIFLCSYISVLGYDTISIASSIILGLFNTCN